MSNVKESNDFSMQVDYIRPQTVEEMEREAQLAKLRAGRGTLARETLSKLADIFNNPHYSFIIRKFIVSRMLPLTDGEAISAEMFSYPMRNDYRGEPTSDHENCESIAVFFKAVKLVDFRSVKHWKMDIRYFISVFAMEESAAFPMHMKLQRLMSYLSDGVPREDTDRCRIELEKFKKTRAKAWPRVPEVVIQCYQCRNKFGDFVIARYNREVVFLFRVIIPGLGVASLSGAKLNEWFEAAKLKVGTQVTDPLTHTVTYTARGSIRDGMVQTIPHLKQDTFYFFKGKEDEDNPELVSKSNAEVQGVSTIEKRPLA